MKARLLLPLLAIIASVIPVSVLAQGTEFTYQGHLDQGGVPANGNYDFTFSVCDALAGGNHIGSTLTNHATSVSNGLFTVTLDFNGIFTGSNYWLELAVRTNGAATFTTLSPRQAVTPTPYAIMAATASTLLGTVPNSSLPSNPNIVGTLTAGSFSGNGGGLTNLNATQLTGTVPAARLPGDIAYTTANQSFSGQNYFLGNAGFGTTSTTYRLSLGNDNVNTKLAILDNGPTNAMGLGAGSNQFRIHLPNSSNRFSFLDTPAGTNELMTIMGTGNVGIGVPSPQSKLQVAGDITAGGNVRIGTNYAPNSQENLRIVRGIVTGAGAIISGNGYSVIRNGVGNFTILFAPPFTNLPTVTVTPQAPGATVTMNGWGTNYAGLQFYFGSSLGDPSYFNFIAIGPP